MKFSEVLAMLSPASVTRYGSFGPLATITFSSRPESGTDPAMLAAPATIPVMAFVRAVSDRGAVDAMFFYRCIVLRLGGTDMELLEYRA